MNKNELQQLIRTMLIDIPEEQKQGCIDTGNNIAKLKRFPQSCEDWSHEQIEIYLNAIEKASQVPFVSEDAPIEEQVSTIMDTEVKVTELDKAGNVVDNIVDKVENQQKYRDDLRCPHCNSMVYDNRNNKKSERSPDFVCAEKNPDLCKGHTGQWRKSWWLNSADLPKEWGI